MRDEQPRDRPLLVMSAASGDQGTVAGGILTARGAEPVHDRLKGHWTLPSLFTVAWCLVDFFEAGVMGRLDVVGARCVGPDVAAGRPTAREASPSGQPPELLVRVDEWAALLLWPLLPPDLELVMAGWAEDDVPDVAERGVAGPGAGFPFRVVRREASSWTVGLRPLWAMRARFGLPRTTVEPLRTTGRLTCVAGSPQDLDVSIAELALRRHAEGSVVVKVSAPSDEGSLAGSIMQRLVTSLDDRHSWGRSVVGGRPDRPGAGPESVYAGTPGRHGRAHPDSDEVIRRRLATWFDALTSQGKTVLVVTCSSPLDALDWESLLWLENTYRQGLEIVVAHRDRTVTGLRSVGPTLT